MGSTTRHGAAKGFGSTSLTIAMIIAIMASFFASLAAVNPVSAQSVDTSLAETVPAESVMFVEVDLDQSSDQWTQVYALLDRSGLSDLAQQQADASPEDIGNMAESYDLTGSAALALTSADALATTNVAEVTDQAMNVATDPTDAVNEVPEGLVVVFQPDDPEALYGSFEQMVSDEADNAMATVETTDYNGVTIGYWTSDDPSVAATATALVGDTVVLATRPTDIEPVIDTINGDVDSLASNENFTQVAGAFTTDSLMFMYADGSAIAEASMAADPTISETMAGVDPASVGYSGVNMYADDSGFRMDTVSISNDGSAPTVVDPTMAGKMPGDSLLFVNGTDLAGSGLPDLLGTFLQMALSQSETDGTVDTTAATATPTVDEVYAELESQLGFNIKTDLLDHLTGEWAIAGNVDQIFSDTPNVDVVFVSEVDDETAVADTTDQISFVVQAAIDQESATIEDRDVNGTPVTTVTVIDGIAPGQPLVIEWAVVDGEFLLGVNNGIESYLNGTGDVLADTPLYQQTMDALPLNESNVVGVMFINLERTIPMIEEAATAMDSSMSVLDNDEACGDYATQEEAQAAYEADEFGLWNLDLDYDGQACEDYFADTASPAASPASMSEDLSILSIGSVSYIDGDVYHNNSILLIGD